jgi:hypothetical protein
MTAPLSPLSIDVSLGAPAISAGLAGIVERAETAALDATLRGVPNAVRGIAAQSARTQREAARVEAVRVFEQVRSEAQALQQQHDALTAKLTATEATLAKAREKASALLAGPAQAWHAVRQERAALEARLSRMLEIEMRDAVPDEDYACVRAILRDTEEATRRAAVKGDSPGWRAALSVLQSAIFALNDRGRIILDTQGDIHTWLRDRLTEAADAYAAADEAHRIAEHAEGLRLMDRARGIVAAQRA